MATLCALFGAAPAAAEAAAPGTEIRRLAIAAFGERGEIDLEAPVSRRGTHDAADSALRAAADGLRQTEALVAAETDRLNRDGGDERELALAPPVADLLARALHYCAWSDGAISPLAMAGELAPAAGAGASDDEAAGPLLPPSCRGLERRTGERFRLAAGVRVDLGGFAAGFAVDRVIETLREDGATAARVRLGRLVRAIGPRADGGGWNELLPIFEGYREPLGEVPLAGRSLAIVWRAEWQPEEPAVVDRRTGALEPGVWATIAVAELAVDADALAVAAMVLGAREGRYRMANLRPVPAVLWLLGSGQGRPLLTDLRWSTLTSP